MEFSKISVLPLGCFCCNKNAKFHLWEGNPGWSRLLGEYCTFASIVSLLLLATSSFGRKVLYDIYTCNRLFGRKETNCNTAWEFAGTQFSVHVFFKSHNSIFVYRCVKIDTDFIQTQ